ncbi:MAG TPA: ROK family protein [Acidobacteriota bacterium]|nr:ROK family protein [Acidobacteriota bacterium]
MRKTKGAAVNKVAMGVDIGGTNSKLGYVDADGNCLASMSIPTRPNQAAKLFFRRLHENACRLFSRLPAGYDLIGIGIGAPNANFLKGTVENPPNLDWGMVDVLDEIRNYYDVPVAVTNDANAAALGEMLFGAARGMKDFILITLGTGLGSGIVANGELVYGADGFAGELGHTVVDPNGRTCGCGKRGCLETYCSATGLCRTVSELIGSTTIPSELRDVSFRELTARKIFRSARRGDPLAVKAFESCGATLGLKLADAVAHLSPEAIFLFGGMAAAADLLFDPARRSMEDNLFPIYRNKVKLLPSGLKENTAGMLGAGALIWNLTERH